jgi:glycosyltransferase involved in cell wall biosynthesis
LVSVGVPVYNGERFLARALESLLSQTFSDFEIIISDNASTDRTSEICAQFASQDSRIRVIRQPRNLGAPRNWNVLVHEARGEFFKWTSANDFCAPTMLDRCVKELLGDPEIILCFGRTQLVDDNDDPIQEVIELGEYEAPRPSQRFEAVCTRLTMNNAQCGLIRLETLRRTRLDRHYPSGDLALMSELALLGKFRLLPELLMFRRRSRGTYTSMLSPLELHQVYNPAATAPMRLIQFRRHADQLRTIAFAPIPSIEKLSSLRFALRQIRWDRRGLWRELRSLFKEPDAAA